MKVYMRTVMLLACLAGAILAVNAADVDQASAQEIAQRFFKAGNHGKLMSSSATMRMVHAEPSMERAAATDYYVFNATDGSAFVIVAGDDRVGDVLGYGEGCIDMDNLTCGMRWLLNDYRNQMEYLYATPTAQTLGPSRSEVTVMPLLSCLWSQSEPYYNQCPIYQGERSVTGCIATAMAQVMYYWKYPNQLPALSGYVTRSHGINVSSLPSTTLDWDNMIDSYIGDYTVEQANAVAKLMRYCGQASRMDYSPDGSGAYVYQQLQGMSSFGYGNHASRLERKNYTIEEWDSLVLDDLVAGRPVLYSGSDPLAGGHAFVVDGYYDGLFHLNWGWAGTGNGYFRLNGLVVRGYSFQASQEILHHIYPRQEVEPTEGYDFEQNGIFYMYDEMGHNAIVTYRDTRFDCYSGDIVIPESVNYDGETLPVIGIGRDAFSNCMGLTSVQIPASVTEIGERAFRNCIGLTTVTLPERLVALGNQAFAHCARLTRIDLPASITSIGMQAFLECQGLTHVEAASLESWLGIDFADQYANPLTYAHHLNVKGQEVVDLEISSAFSAVKRFAFVDCDGLESVTIHSGVDAVEESAFAGCDGITTISLPSSMSTLEKRAFNGCSALTDVAIPDHVTVLPDALFMDCVSLVSVTIPQGVTMLGRNVFNGCSSLSGVVLPGTVESMGAGAFEGCTSLRTVSFSAALEAIADRAFSGCNSLSAIVIPDAVIDLGSQAFYQCKNLTDVTLGSSVSSLGTEVYFGCSNLAVVTCRSLVPPYTPNPNCFTRAIYNKATLRVPAESLHEYKNSGIWPWFKNMVGINVNGVMGDVNGDGEVNLADVNALVDAILSADVSSECDVNGDGEVNIADVSKLIDFLLDN